MALLDEDEVQAPVRVAMAGAVSLASGGVVLVFLATFLATRHLTVRIDRANAERDEMSAAFLRSARLASVGELATGLAHEINNPLAIIGAEQTNLADLLNISSDGILPRQEVTDALERIKYQVKRCASITTRMLQFGRRHVSSLERISLKPHLRNILDLMLLQEQMQQVRLLLDIESDLPDVLLDPLELEQVLVNLVNNSLYAAGGKGSVSVSAFKSGEYIYLEVRDDGEGMHPEVLQKIFEPFYTTKPPGQGTGLGLSVCYGIVRSWGGTIEAESKAGEGTRMHIRIPLREGSPVM